LLAANCSHDILSPTSIPHSNLYDGTPSGFYITNITEDGEFTLISGVSVSIPSLKFNPTNKTFYYDPNEPLTVTAAEGTLLPSVYVVVRRFLLNPNTYSPPWSINPPPGAGDVSETVLLNNLGEGTFDLASAVQNLSPDIDTTTNPPLGEFIGIEVYVNDSGQVLISSQTVYPMLLIGGR